MDANTKDVFVLALGMVTTLGTGWLALELARIKATTVQVEQKVDDIASAVIERRAPRRRIPAEGDETRSRTTTR